MARGLWEQGPSLDREVGGSGGFRKGTRGFGLCHGRRLGYFFPLLGLVFAPAIAAAADEGIALQIPPDDSSMQWDKHWRGSPNTSVRGLSLPLSYWGMLDLSEPQFLHLYRIVNEPKVPPSSQSDCSPPNPVQCSW